MEWKYLVSAALILTGDTEVGMG